MCCSENLPFASYFLLSVQSKARTFQLICMLSWGGVLCTELSSGLHCPKGSPSTQQGPGTAAWLEPCHQVVLTMPSLLGRKGRQCPASPCPAQGENQRKRLLKVHCPTLKSSQGGRL